jgi:hypothetical protein
MSEPKPLYHTDAGDENPLNKGNYREDFELIEVARLNRILATVRVEFKQQVQTLPVFMQERFDALARFLDVDI